MDDLQNRRTFLRAAAAASVAWAEGDLVQVEEALAFAARQVQASDAAGFSILTKAQANVIDALTSRILPSLDGRPGAHEAGVVFFIDRALSTFNAGQKKLYSDGIANLNRRASRKWKGTTSFAALTPAQQDQLLHDIEKTPFFQAARLDTVIAAFSLPTWGGNRNYVGWHLLGFEHQTRFQAPFGYYDAEINQRG